MGKLGIEEWLIRTVQAMYINEKSSARVNGECSPWLDVQVASGLSHFYFSSAWKHYHAISGLVLLKNSFMGMT